MRKIISFVFSLIFIQSMNGQDFHFSQFYATPLTLNPALTGQFDGALRVSGIYRIQWNGVASSSYLYQTPSVSVDANFFKNRLGLGLVFLNDQTNDKLLNTLEGGASISYKILFERMQVSIGMQGWYSQSYLDFSRVQSAFQQAEPNANTNSQKFDFKIYRWEEVQNANPDTIYGLTFAKEKRTELPTELSKFVNLRYLNLNKNKIHNIK